MFRTALVTVHAFNFQHTYQNTAGARHMLPPLVLNRRMHGPLAPAALRPT